MPRSKNDAPRAPMFESLESRELFATTPLPDLVPTLSYTPTTLVQPGTRVKASLTITNDGGAISKSTYVPIRLFVSPTPTLAPNAAPFAVIQKRLSLGAGQSTPVKLDVRLPKGISSEKYFLIVRVNNAQALAESDTTNNTVVSSPLVNPAGTYHGNFSASDGHPGTLILTLSPTKGSKTAASALLADFTIISDGVRLHIPYLKPEIFTNGTCYLAASGHLRHPDLGQLTYGITMRANLNGATVAGTLNLHWQTTTASRNATLTFTLNRA